MVNMRAEKLFWRVLFCLFAVVSCSKDLPEQGSDIADGHNSFIPVESIVFELNGKRYTAGGANSTKDTITLQEEGLRSFRIADYKPKDAYPIPSVAGVNFYQDIYAFNYTRDSIVTLGGEYAKPVNHYLHFTEGNFLQLTGTYLAETDTIRFYNKVNRAYDISVVEIDGIMQEVKWESLGKLRRYRIEINVMQQEDKMSKSQTFSLPFYERTNKVNIAGFPDKASTYIELSPGDSLQLEFTLTAPKEFDTYEWAKGAANDRFDILNGETVEQLYMTDMQNPLLTEKGKRYTDSMVILGRNGLLWIDKDWNAAQATSNSGHIYNEIPLCIIMMPRHNSQEIATINDPTPFFCNGAVRIIAKE